MFQNSKRTNFWLQAARAFTKAYARFSTVLLACIFGLTFQTHGSCASGIELARIPASWFTDFSQSRPWVLSLLYNNTWRGPKSLVDDSTFFVSAEGSTSPENELREFVRMLAAEEVGKPEEESLHCRFPRRVELLRQSLNQFSVTIPLKECLELQKFLHAIDGQGVSLVFSSYYPNNPSSLFGHTFLRIPRKEKGGVQSSPLLDLAVSYAAHPTTANPFLYAYYGLAGGFPGKFDLIPYYMKIQEYNNSESRDLWEYALSISQAETQNLLTALWEVKNIHIDYYYFDDNCAFMLLYLIEAAQPELRLHEKFLLFVIPSDTVLAVAKVPGLVQSVEFRPSSYRRFLEMHTRLRAEDKEILEKVVSGDLKLEWLRSKPSSQSISLLDTFIEYIDFDERLAGSKEPVKWKSIRKEALVLRAEIGKQVTENHGNSAALIIPSMQERPDKAHASSRVSIFAGRSAKSSELSLGWRPALHDLSGRAVGYSRQLEIGFMDTEILWQKKKSNSGALSLQKFSLLSIFSASASPSLVSRNAWLLNLDWSRDNPQRDGRALFRLGFGRGAETSIINAYALGITEAHYSINTGSRVGAGFLAGSIFHLQQNLRLRVEDRFLIFVARNPIVENKLEATISNSFSENCELRLVGNLYYPEKWGWNAGFLYYF